MNQDIREKMNKWPPVVHSFSPLMSECLAEQPNTVLILNSLDNYLPQFIIEHSPRTTVFGSYPHFNEKMLDTWRTRFFYELFPFKHQLVVLDGENNLENIRTIAAEKIVIDVAWIQWTPIFSEGDLYFTLALLYKEFKDIKAVISIHYPEKTIRDFIKDTNLKISQEGDEWIICR